MPRSTSSVRLLMVGISDNETRIAIDMIRGFGLSIQRADDIAAALELLRSVNFDLVMIDIGIDASEFAAQLREERMAVPILTCGQDAAAADSVARIGAGTRGYVPLPPEPDRIAGVILALCEEYRLFAAASPPSRRMASVDCGGQTGVESSATKDCTRAMVGRTVAAVERDLILATLQHCHGNRTHAADILGISIRTMRNKLRTLTAAGIFVPIGGRLAQQREAER